jgi:hypothetical protein
MHFLKHLGGSREVQAALLQGNTALFRVILNPHVIIVHPLNIISEQSEATSASAFAQLVTRFKIFLLTD